MRLIPADIPPGLPAYVPADVATDVPVHRSSVGAMALASGSTMQEHALYVFKPYVYRGWGYDVFEAHPVLGLARPVPKPKPKKRRRKGLPPKPRWDTRPRLHYRPELPDPPYAPRTSKPKTKPERVVWVTETRTPPWVPDKHLRPSPGWKPMKGSDIDSILSEFDIED